MNTFIVTHFPLFLFPFKIMSYLIVLNINLVILLITVPFPTSSLTKQAQEIETADTFRKQSYILFIGLPRVGKFSLINELSKVSNLSEGHFETPQISEFKIEFENNNNELRIIDAPELHYDEDFGLEEISARFISSLNDYLESHNELRYRAPDAVVIYTPFKQLPNNSFFVKMMRGLTIPLTKIKKHGLFFLAEQKTGERESRDDQPSIISEIEITIKENTLFLPSFHILSEENKINNQSLEKSESDLHLSNCSFSLPKLCELIKRISFLNANAGEFCYCNNSISRFELVSQFSFYELQHPKTFKMLQFLKVIDSKSEETELSKILSEMFNKLTENKSFSKDTFDYLKKAFHFLGITKLSDIPKTDIEVASLFTSLDIQRLQDSKILLFLKETLGLRVAKLPFDPLVGKGYHILQDKALQTSPLEMDKEPQLQLTEFGYANPAGVIANSKIGLHREIFYEKFENTKEYLKNRAIGLGINDSNIMTNNLESASIKPGFNIISSACPSIFAEFRTVEFKLEKNVQFHGKFLSEMENVESFNASSPKSVLNWLRLLTLYGTHVITNANGGGSIEFFISDYPCSSADLKVMVSNLIDGIDLSPQQILLKGRIRMSGGDPKFYSENPLLFFEGGRTSLFYLWKDSLLTRPTILPNFVKIKSVTELLNVSHPWLSHQMDSAAEYILNDQQDENLLIGLRKENLDVQNRLQLLIHEKLNCDLEKDSLNNSIEHIQTRNLQLHASADQVSQELKTNEEILSETTRLLEDEKNTVRSLNDNSGMCQGTLNEIKTQIQMERTKIQEIKQTMSTTESKLDTLRGSEINLQQQLTQCNGRQCNACGAPKSLAISLHRYYNSRNGDHFYTTNWNELGGGRGGYKYEGVQARIFPSQESGTVPLFRYYNRRNGDHFYTTNWGELGGGRGGYSHEGVAGYLYPTQVTGSVPLYRYYNRRNGDHFYTTNWAEIGGGKWSYVQEANAGFVCP